MAIPNLQVALDHNRIEDALRMLLRLVTKLTLLKQEQFYF